MLISIQPIFAISPPIFLQEDKVEHQLWQAKLNGSQSLPIINVTDLRLRKKTIDILLFLWVTSILMALQVSDLFSEKK